MSTHPWIDRICLAGLLLALLLTLAFCNGEALGLQRADRVLGYETRLFDTSRVHRVDLVMEDWDEFIAGCEDEDYVSCTAVIDGEAYRNIAIRAKGNTSLSSVRQLGSQRYSFKLEFDHYDSTTLYHGLDKLCLNNLIQDNTMMKDYVVYELMRQAGVASPLCSYVFVTVNGEDWGLYLAVEAIEESFLQRNYGSGYGQLYKPDTSRNGGGRGNGKDFDFEPENFDPENFEPKNFDPETLERGEGRDFAPGGFGGMGSEDVKLQYIDNDPDSYANIFDNAKTAPSEADKARLIASLRQLSQQENLEQVLDVEQVLRYFVVHTFVCNGDSYTGSMVHNYYLYEEEGRLSMLPWDYNLAFGTFQGGAASAVNEAIDLSLPDRPMVDWIFSDNEYAQRYHQLYRDFLGQLDLETLIDETAALLDEYVQRDPSKFCSYEDYQAGVQALKDFAALRQESVARQLAGDETSVETGNLDLSAMGSMGGGMGHGGFTPPEGMTPPEGGPPAESGNFAPGQRPDRPRDLPAADQRCMIGAYS